MKKDSPMLAYILLAIVIGALGGIHVPINGALGEHIESPLVATFVFYGIGFLLIALVSLVFADRTAFLALAQAPRWYLIAGVISVLVVGTSTFLIPRIGALTLFVVFVSAQLVVRMVLSHFGWLGSPVDPVNGVKLFGIALLLSGAFLVVSD